MSSTWDLMAVDGSSAENKVLSEYCAILNTIVKSNNSFSMLKKFLNYGNLSDALRESFNLNEYDKASRDFLDEVTKEMAKSHPVMKVFKDYISSHLKA